MTEKMEHQNSRLSIAVGRTTTAGYPIHVQPSPMHWGVVFTFRQNFSVSVSPFQMKTRHTLLVL